MLGTSPPGLVTLPFKVAVEALMLVAGRLVMAAGAGIGVKNDNEGVAQDEPAALTAFEVKK